MPHRHELTRDQFAKIAHILPGREGHVGVTAKDNHNFLNAVFWRLKTGAPWRDLPQRYGEVEKMSTEDLADGLRVESLISFLKPSLMERRGVLLLDSTVVKGHPHGAGAKKARKNQQP